MHPDVTSDKPGKCSKCGLDLTLSPKEKMKMFQAEKDEILKESLQMTLDDKAATVDRSRFPAPVKKPEVNANPKKKVIAKKAPARKKTVRKK